MSKITSDGLGRGACGYIRQSTADQLLHNHKSAAAPIWPRRSRSHAGWSAVEVIQRDCRIFPAAGSRDRASNA